MCLSYFKDKASALGLDKHVEFAGWLPLEEARKKLCAGDIGYSFMPDEEPNRAASNMKVPQYMARGVVPLVSDVGDLSMTVGGGAAGYVARDVSDVRDTLLRALEDPERSAKAEAARVRAAENLNWKTLADSLEKRIWPHSSGEKPSIYVVATNIPGEVGGPESRNYHLMRQLLKNVTPRVSAFVLSSPRAEKRRNYAPEIGALYRRTSAQKKSLIASAFSLVWARVPPFMSDHQRSGLGSALRAACEESLPDIVHIEQLDGYFSIRKEIPWLKRRGVKIVFDCHNVEYRAFADSLQISPLPKRLLGGLLLARLKRLEIEATKKSDLVIACSSKDAEFFAQYNEHTFVVPNGVDCAQFPPHDEAPDLPLVFMGGVEYPPNADALEFYLRGIHPQVAARIPKVQLYAIGATKEWLSKKGLDGAHIEALGFVKDIRPYLSRAAIGICPVRHGSGTRIKILTYMAAGLPVVSTKKGAEGVDYAPGEHILLEDSEEGFARAVISLLLNEKERRGLAMRGRSFVAAQYDWEVLGITLASAYAILYAMQYENA
jgi:glycosyltransferase involved in cell wall biosynthesis